jgi:hypothetical protein
MKTIIIIFMLIFLFKVHCGKDQDLSKQDNLHGTWISVDKSDTLNFVDATGFYHSNTSMHHDRYDFQILGDSLKIGYSGNQYIYVVPSKHKYRLDGDKLSIDFSNKPCYGFDLELIKFVKQ